MSPDSDHTFEQEKVNIQDEEEQEFMRRVGWKALFGFMMQKHLPVLCIAAFCAAIAALILPAMSVIHGLLFRQFASFASGNTTGTVMLQNVSRYCVYLTTLATLNWLANSIYFTTILTFGELQARSARIRIFNNLLGKDMEWYDNRESGVAALVPGVQMQIRDLQLACSAPLGECVQCCVIAVGALSIALYSSWNLTLAIICTIPIVYLVMSFLSSKISKRAHEQADKLQQALKHVTNAVSSIETVKCFNSERFELQKYGCVITQAGYLYNRQANLRSAQIGFMQFVTYSMFVQGFWYGSYLVTTGQRNPGQVMTTFWGALIAVQGITGFLPQFIVLQKGKIAGARLLATITRLSKQNIDSEVQGGEKPQRCVGDIEFKEVSFAYPTRPDQQALRDATIFFPAGDTSFVIGRSGSGKSTIGQLLVRFYEPTSGTISLDGVPLPNLDAGWLRENVTLVEQHSVLFKDTVRHNIALARRGDGVAHGEVESAVNFALLYQMIQDLPNGLDTVVGAKGSSMSGGQKQRMALARARIRDTPVLILDESTSALDYITRSAILEATRTWRRGKTTIVITHDASQILPDDYVYVLDYAQVVQEGRRKDIEAQSGSSFHRFLISNISERNEEDGSPDNNTDEIMSLYSTPWVAPTRPLSASLLGEQLQSPFFSPISRDAIRDESFLVSGSGNGSIVTLELRRNSNGALRVPPFAALGLEMRHHEQPTSRHGRPCSGTSSPAPSSAPHRTPSHAPPLSSPSTWQNTIDGLEIRNVGETGEKISLKDLKRRSHDKDSEGSVPGVKSLTIREILATTWPTLNWRCRLVLIVAFACSAIHAACTPTFAFVLARLLSTFYIPSNQQNMTRAYALSIFGIALTDGLATWGFHFCFDYCAQAWINSMRMEAMRRILDQPREFFDRDENSVSRIAECLDHFAEEARNLLGRFVGITVVVMIMILIAIVWSLITCWKVTLVALATSPILYAITTYYNAISGKWTALSNVADEDVGEVLHETFTSIRTVRCLVLEEVFRKKFAATIATALRTGLKRAVYLGPIFGLNYTGVLFVASLLFWYGTKLIEREEFSTRNIIQTFSILLLSINHVNFMIMYVPQISAAKDAGSRLLRLSRLPQDSHEHKGSVQLRRAGEIMLNDVDFAYPTRKNHRVLHQVNISIRPGSCTAIVGSSGSGKSTIAALLLKLYETKPSVDGRGLPALTVSDRDVNILHTPTLRSRMAIVSQTPVLFPGTIAENIAYGLDSSSTRAINSIRAAASAAGIDDFITGLPQGYQTVVGEGGSGLSGGQAQRIVIARALIRKPDILILDEATSALDAESAGIVRDTVQRLIAETRGGERSGKEQRGMAVIIITHAREMMAIAEHIIVLDEGRVVEEGSFNELRRRMGPFSWLLRGRERAAPTRGI
ncbi:P-loop containing nucleoside triphosphate hydrolase protein [Lindgomyces ingoldianus]|uniref:P-loop containing nucleoside triphosphate hydrolase protein n=1 Tax=Lindgomyces ingoldianus TaxID=673940 RepID=A0ACB6RB98_9PLEO|nr:P-loop containing nucleoside triphosphate hydrolase protein [Lindgomyces ingoldianus]KAF2476461.1 P-loop containing nucleoside triphosphate hydrolase protein [Lindgomyces ingoldianus]